ncbi:MAG: FAD-dependent oxidoreductase [Myxococcales bacterium]|nr:FAD-dependent oxidoreductase [Myxococcales bacterium]
MPPIRSTEPLWTLTPRSEAEREPATPIAREQVSDCVIIGAGITGLTTAYLLARAGKKVVVVEARHAGAGVTGCSSAHVTEAVDTRYATIESDFGHEGARLVAASSRHAIEFINELSGDDVGVGFVRLPGYLFRDEEHDKGVDLEKELAACLRAGLPVSSVREVPLPFKTRGGLRFENQGALNPVGYVSMLVRRLRALGVVVQEGVRVTAVDDGEPSVVHLERGESLRTTAVVFATHSPLNRVFLQTKVASYRSYLAAFETKARLDGLFWDTADPYHYLRSVSLRGADGPRSWLLVGGADHKTGTTSETDASFEALDRYVARRFDVGAATHRWSAQVLEPVDGLPFIGRNTLSTNSYVATGFSGNGITFGTIAAHVLADAIQGKENPWAALYTATRVKPLAAAAQFIQENVDTPIHLVGDALAPGEVSSSAEIAPTEGKVLRVDGRRVAVFRDEAGALHALSSVCTHLGCGVKFNPAERSWDCPCHGSRFSTDGDVLDGPAIAPLERVVLT